MTLFFKRAYRQAGTSRAAAMDVMDYGDYPFHLETLFGYSWEPLSAFFLLSSVGKLQADVVSVLRVLSVLSTQTLPATQPLAVIATGAPSEVVDSQRQAFLCSQHSTGKVV